jgi:hypothetical protein
MRLAAMFVTPTSRTFFPGYSYLPTAILNGAHHSAATLRSDRRPSERVIGGGIRNV